METLVANGWSSGRVWDETRQEWVVVLLLKDEAETQQQMMVACSRAEARAMARALLEACEVPVTH